jgi:hypothetical protein
MLDCEPNALGSQEHQSKGVNKTSRLYSFESIPEYLQSNPYIRTGYRHGLTFKDCLIR